ncbi:recombinase family protein [Iodidimonas sp. SYSU 1G8]|uniref:recombinase family protein n=1 Tax=Iodidimonas sp. SYSU 1G8 TaxID=3133967 RepID=UPI0031FEEB90
MSLRAVIYARYSSDNQKDASIEDQVELCRRYSEARGWTVVGTFEDRALSGASSARPAFQALSAQLRSGTFDVVLAEAIDRISRKLADVAALFDQFQFNRIAFHTVATGEVTHLHVGLLGTMAQIYLSDLKEKTKRGQLGLVLKGRIPAGHAYGYDLVPGTAGERRINQGEAEIVRRIFREFAAGKSPRVIAHALNAEHMPGPGGRPWRDTTIRGQVDRGTGILNNPLYIGQLVWNRCSYVKDPRTGKRVARVNPPSAWETTPVPELAIIEPTLWEKTRQRQQLVSQEMGRDPQGNPLNRAHRRKFLLSGLVRCGVCGSGFTITGQDRYGCATRRSSGTCTNSLTIGRAELEARVLHGIRETLLTPDLFKAFADEFRKEVIAAQAEASAANERLAAELASIDARITGVVSAIENGHYSPTLGKRLSELEAEQARLLSLRQSQPETQPIILHPNLPELYARQIAALTANLNDPAVKDEAGDVLRSLIEKIVVLPGSAGDRVNLELHGDLARILRLCGIADNKKPREPCDSWGLLSVVAGTGFEPVTFRL